MSRKTLKKSFLDEKEPEEKEIRRKDPPGFVPWSNPNELQATDGITSTKQGQDTSDTRHRVSSARHQDTSPGTEALSQPGPGRRRRPMSIEEERPGAYVVPGIDSNGLVIEEGYDEQVTIATREDESTVHVIASAVDMEEDNRMRYEHDQAVREQDRMRHELHQASRERDQLRQILDNAPIVTPAVATNRDVENRGENAHANHDDLPGSDEPKCGSKGRRWFAMSAILLVVVAIAVTLALVLQPEPTPPPETLSELLSSASSDGGVALADPSMPQNRALTWLAGDPNLASYTDQHKIQRYALATLYYTTKGDSWRTNDYWLSYEDVCGKWYNNDGDSDMVVDCTSDGAVSIIGLGDNNLQGVIPPEIGMLYDSLDALWLYDNALVGDITTEISELTKLTVLSLPNNTLTGAIPSVIGLLTNLEALWLYNNALLGDIPTEIGKLTKLTALSLRNNSLTGTIFPNELGLLTKLTGLELDTNLLTGTIPPSIGTFTNLDFLDFVLNNLSGKIPTELGLLTKLTFLDLGSNGFTGTIPTELGLLTKLTTLNLGSNGFTGTIPSELGLLTNLIGLGLHTNKFIGTIPTTLASLTLLNKLLLYDNDLTGSLLDVCGIGVEEFAANICLQDEIVCTCCTLCCYPTGYCFPVYN